MNDYLKTEREIKGYVDITYSNIVDNDSSDYDIPTPSPISYQDSIKYNGYEKINKNYASLENDYFLLDGSFVLPFKPEDEEEYYNENSGYISNSIQNSYSFYTQFENLDENSEKMKGITLYFKDNIPQNINIDVTNFETSEIINYNINDNDKKIIEIKFDNEMIVSKISYSINNMEYNDRRLRISYIDYGLSDLLLDNNLINFKINEEIGDLNLENPANQCTVLLYDENDMFDLLNPKGFADLLNDNVIVKTFIGIKTQNNGVVYTNKGTFFLDSWKANKREITLNCIDFTKKMKNTLLTDRIGESANDGINRVNYEKLTEINDTLETNSNLKIDNLNKFADSKTGNLYIDDKYVDSTNVFDYLQFIMIWFWGYINCTDKVELFKRDEVFEYQDTLTLDTSLKDNPKYTLRNKLRRIIINQYIGKILKNEKEYWQQADILYEISSISLDKPTIADYGDYHNIHVNARNFSEDFECLKVDEVSKYRPLNWQDPSMITIYNMGDIEFEKSLYTYFVNDEGVDIEINNTFFKTYEGDSSYAGTLNDMCSEICNKIKEEYKTYDVTVDYIGDPNIKPNTIVTIETEYGFKEIKVLKHTLTFDGGLTGTIEGVGD